MGLNAYWGKDAQIVLDIYHAVHVEILQYICQKYCKFFIEIHIKYRYQHLVNMFLYNPAVPEIETFI